MENVYLKILSLYSSPKLLRVLTGGVIFLLELRPVLWLFVLQMKDDFA